LVDLDGLKEILGVGRIKGNIRGWTD